MKLMPEPNLSLLCACLTSVKKQLLIIGTIYLLAFISLPLHAENTKPSVNAPILDANELIAKAMENWRGSSSYSEMTMTVHRADFERSMTMASWTEGEQRSLVRVLAPKKDAGNSTLLDDNKMWTFSPKVNRIIKIPGSMMNQSWMGSDFSNKDISRSTELINQYHHQIIATTENDGKLVYRLESIPKEDAPVVWGKEVLDIREDFVILKHEFFDQDNRLVKVLETLKIDVIAERALATQVRMRQVENPTDWTELNISAIDFDIDIPDSLFTLSNLRNPR